MFGLLHQITRAAATEAGSAQGLPGTDDYLLSGFISGTRIATDRGWRPAEALTLGDRVLTFDNGVQVITGVTRGRHFAASDSLPAFAAPIDVPTGAIGNDEPMVLLPEQPVLVESDAAEAMTGDPFALLPAKALVGFRGIERFRSLRPVEVVTLHCDDDQLLFADSGALLLASAAVPGVTLPDLLDDTAAPTPYRTLQWAEAEALVAAMAKEDALSFGAASYAAA